MPNNGTKADPLVTSGSYKIFYVRKKFQMSFIKGKKKIYIRHVKSKINKILKNKKSRAS